MQSLQLLWRQMQAVDEVEGVDVSAKGFDGSFKFNELAVNERLNWRWRKPQFSFQNADEGWVEQETP